MLSTPAVSVYGGLDRPHKLHQDFKWLVLLPRLKGKMTPGSEIIPPVNKQESQRVASVMRGRLFPSPALCLSSLFPPHKGAFSHQVARQLWPEVPLACTADINGCLAKNLHQKERGELKETEGGMGAYSPAVLVSPHYREGHHFPFQTSISKQRCSAFPHFPA